MEQNVNIISIVNIDEMKVFFRWRCYRERETIMFFFVSIYEYIRRNRGYAFTQKLV